MIGTMRRLNPHRPERGPPILALDGLPDRDNKRPFFSAGGGCEGCPHLAECRSQRVARSATESGMHAASSQSSALQRLKTVRTAAKALEHLGPQTSMPYI